MESGPGRSGAANPNKKLGSELWGVAHLQGPRGRSIAR